jgi:hypothetical protein
VGCPSCGGTERVPIAAGYWECKTSVEERRLGVIPDPMGAPGATRPVADVVYRPCGVRYHEGSGVVTATCACGTFGIGVCVECGKVICGDHSRMNGGQRLCIEHCRVRDETAALAAAQARLTVEKVLVSAAAAGNPGLETWTIEEEGTVTYQYQGRFGKRTGRRWGVVKETPITFWRMHSSYIAENYAVVYALFPDGRISEIRIPLEERMRKLKPDALRGGGDGFRRYQPERQDEILREMCRRYKIPV